VISVIKYLVYYRKWFSNVYRWNS